MFYIFKWFMFTFPLFTFSFDFVCLLGVVYVVSPARYSMHTVFALLFLRSPIRHYLFSANIMESMLCLMVFFNCLGTIRRSKLLALVVSVMTFWKTILTTLYALDIAKGDKAVHDWPRELAFVHGPAAIWIVVPAYVAYTILLDFGWAEGKRGGSSKKTEDDVDGKHHYNLRNRKT